MKATIEYTLPEEQHEFDLAMSAGKLASALDEFKNWLRGVCKHGDPECVNAEMVREEFYRIMNDNDVSL